MSATPPTWIVPQVTRADFCGALKYGAVGAAIAGIYGMGHDALTYRIGPSYFELFKFEQFQWADLGLPRYAFAIEIGFLASWWVGFFAAYFLARYALPRLEKGQARRCILRGIFIIIGTAMAGFLFAYLAGKAWSEDEFQHVAWIHNSSYAGAVLGLILGIWRMRAWVRAAQPGFPEPAAPSISSIS